MQAIHGSVDDHEDGIAAMSSDDDEIEDDNTVERDSLNLVNPSDSTESTSPINHSSLSMVRLSLPETRKKFPTDHLTRTWNSKSPSYQGKVNNSAILTSICRHINRFRLLSILRIITFHFHRYITIYHQKLLQKSLLTPLRTSSILTNLENTFLLIIRHVNEQYYFDFLSRSFLFGLIYVILKDALQE